MGDLKKEIDFNRFVDSYQISVVNIIYTSNWITNLLNQNLAKYAISLPQFIILRVLRRRSPKPATLGMLKEQMIDKNSDVSRIVQLLLKKGLITRCLSQIDHRSAEIIISDAGLDILSKLDVEMQVKDMLKKNISNADVIRLNDLLDKFRG